MPARTNGILITIIQTFYKITSPFIKAGYYSLWYCYFYYLTDFPGERGSMPVCVVMLRKNIIALLSRRSWSISYTYCLSVFSHSPSNEHMGIWIYSVQLIFNIRSLRIKGNNRLAQFIKITGAFFGRRGEGVVIWNEAEKTPVLLEQICEYSPISGGNRKIPEKKIDFFPCG